VQKQLVSWHVRHRKRLKRAVGMLALTGVAPPTSRYRRSRIRTRRSRYQVCPRISR
jgi:hypothetical protein